VTKNESSISGSGSKPFGCGGNSAHMCIEDVAGVAANSCMILVMIKKTVG
jgi:hypothetical protein